MINFYHFVAFYNIINIFNALLCSNKWGYEIQKSSRD